MHAESFGGAGRLPARRVALATCAQFPALHEDDRRLLGPLAAAGFAAEPVLWDDPDVRWGDFEAVVLRSTWDYFQREARFRAWLDAIEASGVRCLNPVPVIRDNLDKAYLKGLAALGVPTVPTVWLRRGDLRSPAALLAEVPWDEVVVKPSVSAGAYRTKRTSRRALLADEAYLHEVLADADALVQPFLPEIVAQGEWSFVYFGDRWSHAVVKEAKSGDFRTQWTHGGRHAARVPPDRLAAEVDAVFRRLPAGCLHTRVDGVELGGRFTVLEIERIEPYLFLGESEGAAERFVVALRGLLARP